MHETLPLTKYQKIANQIVASLYASINLTYIFVREQMYEFSACFMQYQAPAIKTICHSANVNSVVMRDAKVTRVGTNGHLGAWEET